MYFDIESSVFIAALLGAAFGTPIGYTLINVIQWLNSRAENKRDEESDLLECAMTQRRVKVLSEIQIANNWVRTIDLRKLQTLSDSCDEIPFDCDGVPSFVIQVTGQYPQRPVGANTAKEANEIYNMLVLQLRRKLRLRPL